MSAAKPRFSRDAAAVWSRYRRSLRELSSPPDCTEPGSSPTELCIGVGKPRRIVYVTKLAVYRRFKELFHPEDPLLIYASGGLPSSTVCAHLGATQRQFRVPVLFFGDLDPGDLMVFLALTRGDPLLRTGRSGVPVRHVGIGDPLHELFRSTQLDSALLPMSPEEIKHLRRVREICTNLEDVVGSTSVRFLESGRKIELEGLWRLAQQEPRLLDQLRGYFLGS